MLATMLKSKVIYSYSQCRFCKLKMFYMFKTFVSLHSGHVSYLQQAISRGGTQCGSKSRSQLEEELEFELCSIKWRGFLLA